VIAKLADQNPGQKTWGGHAPLNERGRHRRRRDGCTMTAGILGTDVSVNREFGRLDIQLISDIFTDLNLFLTTSSTGAGLKFMPVFNDGKVRGKRLPSCTISDFARLTFARFCSEGFHRLGQMAEVFGNGLIEKIVLFTFQCFALPAELDSAEVG